MIHSTRSKQKSHRDDAVEGMLLRDLIMALKARHGSAGALLQRLDPVVADELHAYAVHRHVELNDFAADCLEQFAADAADTIWQLGIERYSAVGDDPEAALLGSILRTTVRARLQRENVIGSETAVRTVFIGFTRSGHPYTMA